jgi:hypothetical protein
MAFIQLPCLNFSHPKLTLWCYKRAMGKSRIREGIKLIIVMKLWQDKLADFAVTLTAGMLLATGGTLIFVGNQQATITTQVENITEKLDVLTENMKSLEERVRSLEIKR